MNEPLFAGVCTFEGDRIPIYAQYSGVNHHSGRYIYKMPGTKLEDCPSQSIFGGGREPSQVIAAWWTAKA